MSTPKLLPLVSMTGTRHGSRSFRTCELKCANQCDHGRAERERQRAHPAGAACRDVPPQPAGRRGAAARQRASPGWSRRCRPQPVPRTATDTVVTAAARGRTAISHSVVPPNRKDDIVVPRGYEQSVIIGWGDPVVPGARRFDVNRQTPEAQAKQFGYNNDYTMVLPLRDDRKSLLVCNHEYTDEYLMFPTGMYDDERSSGSGWQRTAWPWSASSGSAGPASGGGDKGAAATTAGSPCTTEFEVTGSSGRRRPARRQEGVRHLRQLRRRCHPVGNYAVRRGELQGVLDEPTPSPPSTPQLQAVRRADGEKSRRSGGARLSRAST